MTAMASAGSASTAPPVPKSTMYSSQLFAATLAVAMLVTLDVAAYTYGGMPLGIAMTTASALSLIGWASTTRRRPSENHRGAFNFYIGTVVSLIVLYAEQWSRDFSSQLVRLFPGAFPDGVGLSERAFVGVFPIAGSALLVLGALTYYHGSAFGRFAAWFTFAWGAVAALAVYAFPLFAVGGAHTLPGMLTAPLPLVISLLGIRAMLGGERLRSPQPAIASASRDADDSQRLMRSARP